MTQLDPRLRQSNRVMRLVGWTILIGSPFIVLAYPPGFIWGELPANTPVFGPQHPPSPLDGAHPYLFMLLAVYDAWAILLIRGARDPKGAASLFDWGILANMLHGALMLGQVFIYPNEHAHMWADIPMLFGLSAAMWFWHPNRRTAQG